MSDTPRPRVLLVTDLAYPARGRRYCDEDIALSTRLREDFDLALCHPLDAVALMDGFDVVLVRNSGPVLNYPAAYQEFRTRALERGTRVHPRLTGRGDMAGKRYLLDLTSAGYPVIPTVDRAEDLHRLPVTAEYVVKPKLGADSIGLRVLPREALDTLAYEDGVLVQPLIPFTYEVSFYFVDDAFQYALYAPDPEQRWRLEPYEPTPADLEFARRFIAWNTVVTPDTADAAGHGVQRVDACRTPEGELLLVELEDLNPYLSLDLLDPATRDRFVAALKASLLRLATAS